MSSSLDQRSKSHENHEPSNPSKDIDYGYGPDSQTGYQSGHMGGATVSDPYMNYYAWNMPPYPSNQQATQSMPDNWSGGRDQGVYNNYNDYISSGMPSGMFNQYDYSYWYPSGADPSAAAWGAPMYKNSREYANSSYYGQSALMGGEMGFNGEATNGAMQAMEHGFKNINLQQQNNAQLSNNIDVDKEREGPTSIHTNNLLAGQAGGSTGGSASASATSSGKKSWANIVTQQSSARLGVRPKTMPRAPISILSKGDNSNSNWSQGSGQSKVNANISGGKSMGNEGRQGSSSGFSSSKSNAHHGDGEIIHKSSNNSNLTGLNQHEYNPKDFDLNPKAARFFVIKSFSEDDIHRSIKYSIWCSTEYGNKRLDTAYREREGKGQIFLYYSVNGSGHFCGVALMTSAVDYHSSSSVWAQDKWKGQFSVKWIYVKDVPNSQLRHIKLENNENKPVTNSRDTQEVPPEKGKQVLRIIHQYRHTTSIFDDFNHYEKQQEEISTKSK